MKIKPTRAQVLQMPFSVMKRTGQTPSERKKKAIATRWTAYWQEQRKKVEYDAQFYLLEHPGTLLVKCKLCRTQLPSLAPFMRVCLIDRTDNHPRFKRMEVKVCSVCRRIREAEKRHTTAAIPATSSEVRPENLDQLISA